MIWILATVVGLLGLAALAIGRRGLRVGDAPHCRRCNFDLSGLTADRCPECGLDITTPRNTLRGARRRIRSLIVLGAVLLLIGAGGVAFVLSGSNASLNTYKPAALLVAETRFLHGPPADAAAAELIKRHLSSPLSNSHLAKLADPVIVPDLREAALRGYDGEVWNEPIVIKGVTLDWTGVLASEDHAPPGDQAGTTPEPQTDH